MAKALLISILLASALLPLWAARTRAPARALARLLFTLFGFEVCYLVGVLYVYPRL